jgi:hypothetical protein
MSADTMAGRSGVPAVIAYFGPAPAYLDIALRSAADFNDCVVLLGDETNRGFWRDEWDSSRLGVPKYEAFKRSYVKMSDYPERYETAFWRRPFVVEAWMRAERIDRAFILDSDTVSFANYSQAVLPMLPAEATAAVSTFEEQDAFDWMSSLHFSYWTLPALSDFTSFCIEAYRQPHLRQRLESKYRWHVEGAHAGGICEMTLLYLWREHNNQTIWNPARSWNGVVADWAITTGDNYLKAEYVMRGGFKKFVFKEGIPYGLNRADGKATRFLSIHCQGPAKKLMRLLYSRAWQQFYADLYHVRRLIGKARVRSAIQAAVRAVLAAGRRRSA